MQEQLRKRRRKTWKLLVVKGYDYRRVVNELADEFDVAPSTIKTDINRMDDWIADIAHFDDDSGVGRLMELRESRRRLHKMATEARMEGDTHLELKIRRQIESAIETDIELAQSVGATDEKPDEVEVAGELTISDLIEDDA